MTIKRRTMGHAPRFLLGFVFVLTILGAIGARAQAPQTPAANEQQPLIRSLKGPELFRAYCAPCHGLGAKGDGPVAPSLKTPPADLTVLAKKNRGVFPEVRVRRAITGESVIASHGSREMPIWGPIFHQVEEDVDRGNVRLENLVRYLESIQVAK